MQNEQIARTGGKQKAAKGKLALLVVILISYFVVGFPDGAFTVSWLGMQEEGLIPTLAHTGYILVAYSVTYTLAGVILAWLNRFWKLQTIYLCGLVLMGAGFIGLTFSTDFFMLAGFIALYGFGTGQMASSMNAYMTRHFTARHNNWMHCFWGAGATVSPLIMGQMMGRFTWREGYYVIAGLMLLIAVMLFVSMYKKMWIDQQTSNVTEQEKQISGQKRFLTKKRHQVVEIATFFFLGGTDYTLVFFTGAALVARGMDEEYVLWFSAIYYICMTVGRIFFGWAAKFLREVPIVRIGCALAVVGIGVLYFTGNILGMALTGLGLAPLLPTLVSDTSNRFAPKLISRLVGLELAAFGAGIAVLFFTTSQILAYVSLEMLFPLGVGFILLVFLCNEWLARAIGREKATKSTPVDGR